MQRFESIDDSTGIEAHRKINVKSFLKVVKEFFVSFAYQARSDQIRSRNNAV